MGRHGEYREPHGIVGRSGEIQITAATHELIRDAFVCEPRGPVQVKGKSEMETHLLVSRRDGERAEHG